MNCSYKIWTDILIPLIAALIGGGLTLLGVVLTIKWEKRKADEDHLEKIRPFFVLENAYTSDINQIKIKQIDVKDDSMDNVNPDQIIFHWCSLLLSNQSESVCMLSYIKINGIKYASFGNVPIKSGDYCEIRGFPLSVFIRKTIDDISIGFLDKFFNPYEYKVQFDIEEFQGKDERLKKYCNKTIVFSLIDCSTNLASKRRKDDGNDRKTL